MLVSSFPPVYFDQMISFLKPKHFECAHVFTFLQLSSIMLFFFFCEEIWIEWLNSLTSPFHYKCNL